MKREQFEGRTLTVMLHGRRVGKLTREGVETLSFQYDSAYASDAANPPLSARLPLRHETYGHRETHAWFNALLAEGTRRQHLARIVNAASLQTWELLHAAGGECAGAIQTVGEEHHDEEPRVAVLAPHQIYALLRDTPVEPIGTLSAAARISLAGAQEKVALYRCDDGQWALPLGGHPSSHILKPQSTRFERLVENEHYCMTLARRSGIDAAHTSVQHMDDLAVLVVERYDRVRTHAGTLRRVHQEDFAQALGSTRKYESEGGPTTREFFTVPGAQRDALFERIMFNWIVGNCDAHAKNYSILEPGTARARLAPAYDIVSTECYEELDRTLATGIGQAANLNEVDRDQSEALGRQIGYAREEASERVHALSERVLGAVEACTKEGVDSGPVRTDIIEARAEETCDWAQSSRRQNEKRR